MKRTILTHFLFGFSYIIVSAQPNVLTDINNFIPKNLIQRTNFKSNSEILNQIGIYEYLYVSDIDPITTTFDYIEPLYNGKLFYNQRNSITINHISIYNDGSKFEIPNQYFYDNNGNLLKILNLEDSRYKIEFIYQNGLLIRMKNYRTSIPMTITEGHKVTHDDSQAMLDEVVFKYSGGSLVQQEYLTNQEINLLLGRRSYIYYQDSNNPDLTYIKSVERSLLNEERLICFENNKIKYITYSYKTSFNDNSVKLQQILIFNYIGKKIQIKHYEPNRSKSGDITLSKEYELQVGENSSIEYIRAIFKLVMAPHISEKYFRYHYSQNRLIGFEIFERTIYNQDKSTETNPEFKLSKAYFVSSK